jgi:hypothetical protein
VISGEPFGFLATCGYISRSALHRAVTGSVLLASVIVAGNAIAAASTTLSQEATLPDLERDWCAA